MKLDDIIDDDNTTPCAACGKTIDWDVDDECPHCGGEDPDAWHRGPGAGTER